MKVLITGATGFIGSHLLRAFSIDNEIETVGVTRSPEALSERPGGIVVASLADSGFVELLPTGVDCIIHLAQSNRYREFPEGVDDMKRVNIDATVDLLEWARRTRVKQFIFTSTANVYGESRTELSESDPTRPFSFYGATKLAAEHLALQYREYFQVDILRCFTVFGPGQKGMLIPNIAEMITQGKEISLVQGDGVYLSPVYVEDVVTVIKRFIGTVTEQRSRLANLCGDQATSLREIVSILEKEIGRKAVIRETDGDVPHFVGSNRRLKELLSGFEFEAVQSALPKIV